MSRSERDKGLRGEAEAAAIWKSAGLEVRGLEGSGDHLIVCAPELGLTIHEETKRHETARPWAWWEQASTEAPGGTFPLVAFRRNRSPWLAIVDLEQLAALIGRASEAARNGGKAGGLR